MSEDARVDLALVARQQRRLLDEMAATRDDMGVLIAVLRRLDDRVAGLVDEMRAMRGERLRVDRRGDEAEGRTL